jgi:hypothetical protein
MTEALYLTIWLALLLFAAGESGRSFTPRGASPPRWAWWAFAAGLVLAVVHTLLAFSSVHGWSHASAVHSTAVQTQSIYGITFGGGVYVNYLFLAVWMADAWWWRASQPSYARPAPAVWALRAFYMVIIFNAAVVFASGIRRVAGLLLVSWLARVWSAGVSSAVSSGRPSRSASDRIASR